MNEEIENLPLGQVPMGTIVAFALNYKALPANWLMCDGNDIPAKYQSLITALGNTKTPDLCGRTLIGCGVAKSGSNYQLGNVGGEEKHQLTIDELAKHSHTINNGNFGVHQRSFQGESDDDIPYETNPRGAVLNGTDNSGNDGYHNNMQPYYVVNYIIYAGN